jgi:hypothetical protein
MVKKEKAIAVRDRARFVVLNRLKVKFDKIKFTFRQSSRWESGG